MLDLAKISAHLDALHAQGAAALDVAGLSVWLRQTFSGLSYAALRAFADREACPAATRYSQGQNMGYLGYYAPSGIRLRITTNMRRGRLTRVRGNNSCYIYEYGKDGALLRILMPGTSTATYHFAGEGLQCFVSFQPYTRSGTRASATSSLRAMTAAIPRLSSMRSTMAETWNSRGWRSTWTGRRRTARRPAGC